MAFVNLKRQKYIMDTLLEIEELTENEIFEQLDRIKECTTDSKYPIYPFYEYVDNGCGEKVAKELERTEDDGKKVAEAIIARMLSFIGAEITKLAKQLDDILEFCSWLRYLDNDISLETELDKEKILENFDQNFSYLQDTILYSDIYYSFRQDYIKNLEAGLRKRHLAKQRRNKIDLECLLFSPTSAKMYKAKILRQKY